MAAMCARPASRIAPPAASMNSACSGTRPP